MLTADGRRDRYRQKKAEEERSRTRSKKVSFATNSKLADPQTPIYVVANQFQTYLHMPDPGALYAVLGAAAANMIQGSKPVWLMLVGSSGCGKTTLVNSLLHLPNTRSVGDIDSKAAFLSGVKKSDQAEGATGGMLHEMGTDGGALIWPEFSSVLELNREALRSILTALRQIYDGKYERDVGTDGHKKLTWTGKLAAFGACTHAIDRAHAFGAAMGERFLLYRMPRTDGLHETLKAFEAEEELEGGQDTAPLADLVHALFDGCGAHEWYKMPPRALYHDEKLRLTALGQFTSLSRSGVERDSFNHQIVDVPTAESPMRAGKALRLIYLGMEMLGLDEEDRWSVVYKIALDSMPLLRLSVIQAIRDKGLKTATQIARATNVSMSVAARAMGDLSAHGIIEKIAGSPDSGDEAVADHGWKLSKFATIVMSQGERVDEAEERAADASEQMEDE